jgi:hypothetical protein
MRKPKEPKPLTPYQSLLIASYVRIGMTPTLEYKFHPVRKWRMDLAFLESKVFVEIQGGIFIQGRHSRGAAMLKEWEKLNTAAVMGWRVLFCQPKDALSMDFMKQVREACHKEKHEN